MLIINKRRALLLFGLSALLLNSVFRDSMYHVSKISLPGYFGTLNWIAIAAASVVLFLLFYSHNVHPIRVRTVTAVFLLALCILVYYANYKHNNDLGQWVLFGSIVPGLLLYCFIYYDIDTRLMFEQFLKISNVVLMVLFTIGIIDYFIGGKVNNFLADVMSTDEWARMVRSENETFGFRMCTIVGSPLINAFYALLFVGLNSVYERIYDNQILNKWVVYLFGMLTIFLTGSRIALAVGIVMITFTEFTKRWGVVRLIVIVVALIVLINTPIFKNTIGLRLQMGFMNGADARYRLFTEFMNNRFGRPEWFTGGGYNHSRELTAMSIANSQTLNFEYPFLMFFFDYGIVATAIYYILFFLIPEIELLIQKQYFSAFIYIVLFFFLQSFNMIAQFYDANLLLAFIIILLTSVSRQPQETIDDNDTQEVAVALWSTSMM